MSKADKPKWRWYTVKCVECGGTRWPYVLGDKPTDYVCQRCTALTKADRKKQRETARRLDKWRFRKKAR